MVRWPNNFMSDKLFQKGQIRQIWPFLRPNCNPATKRFLLHRLLGRDSQNFLRSLFDLKSS